MRLRDAERRRRSSSERALSITTARGMPRHAKAIAKSFPVADCGVFRPYPVANVEARVAM